MLGKHINIIDQHLKVVSEAIKHPHVDEAYLLKLELFYDNTKAGNLEFTLQGFEEKDVMPLLRGIKESEYLLRHIDEYLCGDEM